MKPALVQAGVAAGIKAQPAAGKVGRTVLAISAGVGGALLLRKLWRDQQRQNTYAAAASDASSPEAQATAFMQALNPSGFELLRRADGTDEAAIFSLLPQVRDFPAVATAYRRLTQNELLNDLQKELSPQLYQTVLASVQKLARSRSPLPPQTAAELERISADIHATISAWGWTDTDRLMLLAGQIRNLPLARQVYQRKYRRSLDDHLKSQWTFSAADYESFIRIASLTTPK